MSSPVLAVGCIMLVRSGIILIVLCSGKADHNQMVTLLKQYIITN